MRAVFLDDDAVLEALAACGDGDAFESQPGGILDADDGLVGRGRVVAGEHYAVGFARSAADDDGRGFAGTGSAGEGYILGVGAVGDPECHGTFDTACQSCGGSGEGGIVGVIASDGEGAFKAAADGAGEGVGRELADGSAVEGDAGEAGRDGVADGGVAVDVGGDGEVVVAVAREVYVTIEGDGALRVVYACHGTCQGGVELGQVAHII